MRRQIRIGLIGHRFMGKAHSHALHSVAFLLDAEVEPIPAVLCGLEEDLEATAARYRWRACTRRWSDVVADPAIDVVDIATPGSTHCEIALAAAQAGKHLMCEKPLALNAAEARRMYEAAERAGVRHLVNFNYRRVPAVMLAKQLIESGELGEISFFQAAYWQDWALEPTVFLVWRMDKRVAGAGVMADNGSHLIDLARYLLGEIQEVAGAAEIVIKRRPLPDGTDTGAVSTDDTAGFLLRFRNGALGLLGASRISAGHKNALRFEVNGRKGSLSFDLERLNELQLYQAEDRPVRGFRTVLVTDAEHPYLRYWWPPGHMLGWEHTFVHQYYEFLKGIVNNTPVSPTFFDGWRAQEVLDAMQTAVTERCWVKVPSQEETKP